MSFSATKKRAQDQNRHVNSRRVSVRSCIQLCLCYSGLNGYQSIVDYYNKTDNLNGDNLSSETIDKILTELTIIREQSILLRQDYSNYRKKQKQIGQRTISKSEELIQRDYRKRINELWNKFDTDENRKKKEVTYAERRKELDKIMKDRK
jgi:hypothetical protein